MVAKLLLWWLSFLLCRTINASYKPSLEFVAVNSHLAGLLEEGEHQPPTEVRYPRREFWLPRHQRHVRDRKNIRKSCVPHPCQSDCRKEPYPQPICIQAKGNCTNGLLSIKHHVYRNLDNSDCNTVRLFTMDFSKVFDYINHSKLSAKLKQLPLNRTSLIGTIASCLLGNSEFSIIITSVTGRSLTREPPKEA